MEFEITQIGERGQVVIPQEFRKSMGLKTGDKFFVMERADTLILKRVSPPTIEEFDEMIRRGHERAKKLNLTQKDTEEVRKRARSKK